MAFFYHYFFSARVFLLPHCHLHTIINTSPASSHHLFTIWPHHTSSTWGTQPCLITSSLFQPTAIVRGHDNALRKQNESACSGHAKTQPTLTASAPAPLFPAHFDAYSKVNLIFFPSPLVSQPLTPLCFNSGNLAGHHSCIEPLKPYP